MGDVHRKCSQQPFPEPDLNKRPNTCISIVKMHWGDADAAGTTAYTTPDPAAAPDASVAADTTSDTAAAPDAGVAASTAVSCDSGVADDVPADRPTIGATGDGGTSMTDGFDQQLREWGVPVLASRWEVVTWASVEHLEGLELPAKEQVQLAEPDRVMRDRILAGTVG